MFSYGQVEFERTYYKKASGGYEYLADTTVNSLLAFSKKFSYKNLTRTFFFKLLDIFFTKHYYMYCNNPEGGTEMGSNISDSVIKRLPRYYRFLGELKASGMTRISSRELSERMGLTASQIRQDLNCFGGFGQQGYGYNIELLQSEIARILGIDAPKNAILIGVGNLGKAITMHIGFETKGFRLIGLFDCKESLIGQMIKNLPVRNITTLDEFCRENLPEAAFLCIPKKAAVQVSDQLVRLGIKGFWNFSHYDLALKYPEIKVENVHFGDSLMTLSYRLHNE